MAQDKKDSPFWDLYARCYDSIYHLMPYRKLLWDTLQALDLKSGMKILDAGCGTGNFELFASGKNIPSVEIEAIDSSPAMLSAAIGKCSHLHFVNFKLANLDRKLNYDYGTFDRILALNTFHDLKDPLFTIREFLRILRPNGKIVMVAERPDFQFASVLVDHVKRTKNIWGLTRKSSALLHTAVGLSASKVGSLLKTRLQRSQKDRPNNALKSREELGVLFLRNRYQNVLIDNVLADQSWAIGANKFQFLPFIDDYESKHSFFDLKPKRVGSFEYKLAEGTEIPFAQEFHYYGYVRVGYISNENPVHRFEDGYHKHSAYIVAKSVDHDSLRGEGIVGVIRQTHSSHLGLPVINEFELYPEVRDMLMSIDPNKIVEIGALYTEPGHNVAKGLYSYAWQRSKLLGHEVWLAAIDSRLFKAFRERWFFEFRQIGKERFYLGSPTIPAMMDCQLQKQHIWEKAPHLASVFEEYFLAP